jgi:hypothetical protein
MRGHKFGAACHAAVGHVMDTAADSGNGGNGETGDWDTTMVV